MMPQHGRRRFTDNGWFRHCRFVPVAALLLLLTGLPRLCFAASSCFGNATVTITAMGVSFGSCDPFLSSLTPGQGTLMVSATCRFAALPFTVNYSMALSTGSNGSFASRTMKFGANALQYNLYASPQLLTIWGDGTAGTQTVSDQIIGTCQNQFFGIGFNCSGSRSDTVYGGIPALQNAVPSSYADSITVTVNF